jgi:hypothetical protein
MLVRRIMLAVAFGAALAGCGAPSPPNEGQNRTTPPLTSGAVNDPKLNTAADSIVPELERAFPDTYSGVELKHSDHTMIIYRLPDPTLDEFVRQRISDITVVFRDAKLSRTRMHELADRILRDREYWRSQGITINGVGPKTDGSSVEVLTAQGSQPEERALAAHYGDGIISVRAETPVIPPVILPTAPPFTRPS